MGETVKGLLIPTADDVEYYLRVSRLRLSHHPAGGTRLSLVDDVTVHLPNGESDTVMGDYRQVMGYLERDTPKLGTPEAESVAYKLGLVVGNALAKSGTMLHAGFNSVATDLSEGAY